MTEKEKKPLLPRDRKALLKLGAIFALGLLLILFGSMGGNEAAPAADIPSPTVAGEDMESRLENILSQIKGAGRVAVCLNYSILLHKEYAVNENESRKSQNETAAERSISTIEESLNKSYFTAGSQNEPLLLQEFAPVPESVLIVAEGAANAQIREELFSAVQSFLGLPANKISISEMK